MAVDRAAAGDVAEEPEPGEVLARPRRRGGAAAEGPFDGGGGEHGRHVAAREAGHVERRRDDPARGPGAGRVDQFADVLGLFARRDVVPCMNGRGILTVIGRLLPRIFSGPKIRRCSSCW